MVTPATHSEEAVGQAMAAGFYQALVDAAPDAIIVVDARGVIVLANRICETLLGWTPQDLVGRPLEVVVPPDLRGAHVNHRGGYFARPRTRPMAAGTELSALRADGTRVPVDISLSPIATPEGTVVMAAIRDATQRRRMEAELQASERRWKTSLASMLDAFCILRCVRDGDGVVDFEYVYLNAPAARTFGRTAESLIGTRVSQSLPGFPASGRFRDYLHVVETGEPLTSTQHRYAEDNGAAGGVPGDNYRVEGVFDSQVWKLDDGVAATWRDVSDREASALALRASEERFRASVEDLPDTLSIFAAVRDGAGEIVDFRWQYANRAAGVTFGIRPEDLAGRTLLEVLPDHGPSGIFATYRRVVDTGEPYVEPCLWYEDVWGDGVRRRLAFEMRATKLHDGVVVMARDITSVRIQADDVARHQADLERTNTEIHLLNELAELLQGCLSSAEAYPIAARLSGGLFPGSGGSISITNASRDLVESMATWGEADIGQPAFAPTDCWAVRRGKPHLSGVVEPRCPHLATSRAAWCLCVPMLGQGEAIGVYHLLWAGGPPAAAGEGPLPAAILQPALSVAGQISMATANLKLRDKLRTLSIRDPLTGLFNRRYMEETLTREISLAGRRHTPLSVLQLDIDRFKEFNDAYGHEAGDAVMRHVSQAMQRLFRVSSVACRYGGEEFTIVLPDCALADAVGRAEELRRLLASAGVPHGRTLLAAPTITCGVATFPQHAGTAEGLVGCADAALYAAKAAGRNRVLAYDPTTDRPGPPAP
ncbi:MAG TPA: diguanylate cyclase [Actinomycetota bacterium]|nr:diguanylate cyclase [Actinomycetota bacterium]